MGCDTTRVRVVERRRPVSSEPLIRAELLSKEFHVQERHGSAWGALRDVFAPRYRVVRAVEDVSFVVSAGELVGYIGPNGAGKSTTIKMLTGILVPSGGNLSVSGKTPHLQRKDHVRHIGVVFGQRTNLWWDLPTIDSFDLLKYVYRIPAERYRANLEFFCDLLDLQGFLHTPVRTLSLGQRMRADLAATLLHDPDILFLDEPTIGLDVVAKQRIRTFIRRLNHERGTTVILTTHDLGDVEKLCDRVLMIDHGRLVYDGDLESLRHRFGYSRVLRVDLAQDYGSIELDGADLRYQDVRRLFYRFDTRNVGASQLIQRLTARYHVADIAVREAEIEEIVRRIYEGGLDPRASS
jgi:ABC-2 type transport system ATP-binding protein